MRVSAGSREVANDAVPGGGEIWNVDPGAGPPDLRKGPLAGALGFWETQVAKPPAASE